MDLVVGKDARIFGSITKLKAVAAKPPALVEEMLGYAPGRLVRGYWICLLADEILRDDFELAGTTANSGGKLGAPERTIAADDQRVLVHANIMSVHGKDGYEDLQRGGLATVTPDGPDRIVKIIPVIPHMKHASPSKQYPMGGAALQWIIKKDRPKLFFVAAFIAADGKARTRDFTVRVDVGAPYDDRARLYRFLSTVKTI